MVLKKGDDFEKIAKDATDGLGVDAVFEVTGSTHAVADGLKMIRAGGTMALLGIFNDPLTLELNDNIIFKCVNLKGIYGRKIWETWIQTNGLLRSGSLNLDPIITHRFKFDKFLEAMETMRSGNSGKITLTF